MWSDITPSALVNGTGTIVYSLCTSCASTITICDRKYYSKFCDICDKRTFALKYPDHAKKHPLTFYGIQLTEDGKVVDAGASNWKSMVPCTVTGRGTVVTAVLAQCCRPTVTVKNGELTFEYCVDCQKRTTFAKYPKPIRSIQPSDNNM